MEVKEEVLPQVILPTEFSLAEILKKPQEWHEYFDREIWKKDDSERPSYHNWLHIEAVKTSAETYFRNIERFDPLHLRRDLVRWNEGKPVGEQVNMAELEEAFLWKALTHDLGNIMKEVRIENGELAPDYLDKYTSDTGEKRSQDIAEFLIKNSNMDKTKVERMVSLVRYLTGETTYGSKEMEKPFAAAARVFDQLGNAFFNKTNYQLGLAEEMYAENPDGKTNPYKFVNFVQARKPLLVFTDGEEVDAGSRLTTDQKWAQLKEIWGFDEPQEKPERLYPDRLVPTKDFLDTLRAEAVST